MDNQSSMFVSVIIPVFNDAKQLKNCLEALQNQTYPKKLYEIIVVDNASDEDIASVVSQFGQALTTHQSRPGSYAARNKGFSLAKGEVIAFTDADCIPALDWIEKGVANLLRVSNCGLVAGKVEFFFKNQNQPTAVELYDSVSFLQQQKYVETKRFGATANLFTFKSVIKDVGLFNDTLKSCADREWGQRVFSAGYKQIYADDCCVAHPARHSLKQLYKKTVRLIGGFQDVKKQSEYSFNEFVREVVRDLRPPLKTFFHIWSDEKLKGHKQKIQFTSVVLFIKYLHAWERTRLQLGGKSQR